MDQSAVTSDCVDDAKSRLSDVTSLPPVMPGPSHVSASGHVSAFKKPGVSSQQTGSPKPRKYSSLSRRKERQATRPDLLTDSVTSSEMDLPTFDRLHFRPELQRPDSVITTSSVVSSEAEASVVEETEAEEKLSSIPLSPAPPSVYTISGLYGPNHGNPGVAEAGDKDSGQAGRTHKRSASTMATSIVIRSCGQKTHKRSHSHTVGTGQPYHHRRTGSSGFVMGHRRAASGASAIVDTLEKITGGVSRSSLHHSTSEYLQSVAVAERRASSRIQDTVTEDMDSDQEDLDDLQECGYYKCKPKCAQSLSNIKLFVLLMSILVTLQQVNTQLSLVNTN